MDTALATVSDETLMVNFAASGDDLLLRELVHRYSGRFYRAAYLMLYNGPDSEDAVQDTFVRIVTLRKSFDTSTIFAPWAFTILRNRCIDEIRKKKVRSPVSLTEELPSNENTGMEAEINERNKAVQKALDTLSAADREIVALRIFAEMEFSEIGVTVKMAQETAKKRFYRALKSLQPVISSLFKDACVFLSLLGWLNRSII